MTDLAFHPLEGRFRRWRKLLGIGFALAGAGVAANGLAPDSSGGVRAFVPSGFHAAALPAIPLSFLFCAKPWPLPLSFRMHSRELVEVAALVAAHGPVLIEGPGRISSSALHQYWAASKCRLDRWLRSLKRIAAFSSDEPGDVVELQDEIRAVLDEILVAEIALRVWTAVLYAYDRRRKTDEAEPIARSVFLGHLDVRQRALALLIHCPHITAEEAVQLNRLRRRAERWTDLLLGYISQHYPVDELAFEPERCAEFAADLRHEQRKSASEQAWRLALASMRVAFRTDATQSNTNADANRDIAGSILACFPGELFNSTGELPSLWLVRLSHAVSDAQGMVDELLETEPPVKVPTSGLSFARASAAYRRRLS